MLKRPTIRVGCASTTAPSPPVPIGHPSVVGRIVDRLRNTQLIEHQQTPWAPSVEYEFIASHLPSGERDAYIQKSREWFEEHTTIARVVEAVVAPVIDNSHILNAFEKHARVKGTPGRPAPKDMANAMRAAGYSEPRVTRHLQWCQNMEARSDDRQEALDKIFAKWPSASKPDPKPKVKKVIKAVKKRIANEQAT